MDRKEARQYMQLAIEEMKKSVVENNKKDPSPHVGAVLIKPDGTIDKSYRGELREGDHAEYTLLDKKNREENLTGSILFATLEPCGKKARSKKKTSCSERIVNARISEVWFGIEDPNPNVDREGLEHMLDNGIKVLQFDRDLHKKIEEYNKKFLAWAIYKKEEAKKDKPKPVKKINLIAENTNLDSLSKEALTKFLIDSGSEYTYNSPEFIDELLQMNLIEQAEDGEYIPTGNAILLFGKKPRLKFEQASVKAKVDYGNGDIGTDSFDDALILIPDQVEAWVKKVIPESFDRSKFKGEKVPFFPPSVVREAIVNAIIHRDYENDMAKVQLEITPEKIAIKSPGKPVPPITLEALQNFTATSLSRNKKLTLVFNQMHLMEETGVGMDTFREMRSKHHLPLPIITYDDPNLVVTFPRTADAVRELSNKEAIAQLNDEELAGYDFVKEHKEVSRKEYEDHFGYDARKANRHLGKLLELGLIGDNGKGKTSPNYRYVYNG
jgi:ATP-dependent DNA helicase RecG